MEALLWVGVTEVSAVSEGVSSGGGILGLMRIGYIAASGRPR